MKKIFFTILFTVCTLIFLNEINSKNDILVDVTVPRTTTVYNSISVKGTLQQQNDNFIAINQNGIVDEVYFTNYSDVQSGDLLMTIKITDGFPDISRDVATSFLNTKTIVVLDTNDHDYVEIRATTDGKILEIPNKSSSIVNGVPFLSISSSDGLIAVIDIPERYITKVGEGQSVNITGSSFGGTLNGVINTVKPYTKTSFDILNTASETKIEAFVDIVNPTKDLILGVNIDAEIIVDKVYNAVVIPYSSILQEEMQEYVMIICDNVAKKVPIATRYELKNEIEVISGVTCDDIIIMDTNIEEGTRVYYE